MHGPIFSQASSTSLSSAFTHCKVSLSMLRSTSCATFSTTKCCEIDPLYSCSPQPLSHATIPSLPFRCGSVQPFPLLCTSTPQSSTIHDAFCRIASAALCEFTLLRYIDFLPLCSSCPTTLIRPSPACSPFSGIFTVFPSPTLPRSQCRRASAGLRAFLLYR